MSDIMIGVSLGEAIDKLSILVIKSNQLASEEARKAAGNSALTLNRQIAEYISLHFKHVNTSSLEKELSFVNKRLWDMEDKVRNPKIDDDEHLRLSKSIRRHNDERARIKREIDKLFKSELTDWKSYESLGGMQE